MIRPFPYPNRIKNSIISYLILFLFVFSFVYAFESTSRVEGMKKIHPVKMKRNIAIRDATQSSSDEIPTHKRLRRLPHVFGKVLELPFPSDADVSVEEGSDCLRFVANADADAIGTNVSAHTVEIHPGVTKIVLRRGGGEMMELFLEDVWRFRLPVAAQPEMASAVFVDGELIVTVPKSGEFAGGEALEGVGRLILVQ